MADQNIPPAPENEDAELDKSLQADLDAVKAESQGASVLPPTPEVKPETPSDKPKEEPPSPAPENTEKTVNPEESLIEGFKTPTKGKFESEESYQKRLELADLVARRKAAQTPEEKQKLSEEISGTRKDLKALNHSDKITPPNDGGERKPLTPEEIEAEKLKEADLARLKELGGATKEDITTIIQQERFASDVRNTLETFVGRHPELKDADTRDVFFDFVDANYNWANKSGKELMTVLELARENMFKPSETIQERVLKGANVAEKINAMQFPGGAVAKPGMSAEQKKSVDELKATGMSEEKALELISD